MLKGLAEEEMDRFAAMPLASVWGSEVLEMYVADVFDRIQLNVVREALADDESEAE